MLEWIATPYGEMVPKFNGTLLASKVDPVKEAKTWTTHHSQKIMSALRHFVLGVGAGHHVIEMARHYPDTEFICIEYLESLSVSQMYADIRTFLNIELIVGQDIKKILKNERVQQAFGDVFTILNHPSDKIAPEYYREIASILTARDWKSFNQILKFRSEDEMFLNEINFTPKAQKLISANDIIGFIENKQSDFTEQEMIWMALGELIK